MNIDQDVDTQLDDLTQDSDLTDGSSADNTNDEDFLVVNDRQKYKTKEDAMKAFDESGKRISALSVWEKTGKELGITDPARLKAVVTEYSKLLAQSKGNKAASAENVDEPDTTPEEKKAQQWLMKAAKKVGLLSASDVKELKDKLASYETRFANDDQRSFDSLVDQGRTQMKSLMKEAKLVVDNEDLNGVVESGIADYINRDPERVEKFKAGGESHREIVAEAFKKVAGALDLLRKQNSSAYGNKKQEAIARNGKSLPQPGTSRSSNNGNNSQNNAAMKNGKRIKVSPMAAIHDKAWEVMQKHNGSSQENE